MDKLQYPSGYMVVNRYTSWSGALDQVAQWTGTAIGQVHWTMGARHPDGQAGYGSLAGTSFARNYDGFGRVSDITAGVGGNPISLQNAHYTFDALGNLTQRSESVLNPGTQSFAYDQVDRLTSYAGQSAAYDAAGNLTSRAGTSYSYQAGSHRITSYGGTGYGYDANGNVTGISGSTPRTITPTAFNLPATITQGGTTLAYVYDGGHRRIKETSTSAAGTTTTYYLGGYEELTRTDGIAERRHYLATPDGTAGIHISRSDGTTAPRYWLTDHLGSVVGEVDQAGALKQSATFGAWGDRTQVVQADPRAEDRGFTGHEHLVEVGLIHMNGRVYDPITGRFLAADPLIQDPYDAQSYNRYSYVRNNPLSFTDPSGYSWWTKWRKPVIAIAAAAIISPLVAAEVMWALAPTSANAAAIGELAGAVAGGFAAGGIQGGNIESAVAGAMSASVFFAAGSIAGAATADQIAGFGRGEIGRVALHAGAGCFTGASMGGSCGKQAVAGGFSELAGPIVDRASTNAAFGVVAHAVGGGLGSIAAGGKFENGAMTGAFGYLFNQCAHGSCATEFEQLMYDWWPGYKAGTLLHNQIWGDGSWTGWEVLDAASVGLGFAGRGAQLGSAARQAAHAEQMGLLREAGSRLGNFSVGTVDSIADANALGKAWVGPGYRVSDSGRAWLSLDGTKVYRPPNMKPTWGEYQANFMRINPDNGRAMSNAHLSIRP